MGGLGMNVEKEKLLEMFRKMVMIRQFETRVKKSFAEGDMPGFVHLYAGEEAIAVGCCANLRTDDYITSTHRGHGHLIAKGGKITLMMAELYGKKAGYCKGKGGSMHIADMDLGILGANGIVGAGITIATGAGLSAKLRGTDQVTLCFFGDGASNTTRFHEGINLAAIWDLPVVFIIENNHYAESTSISYSCKLKNLSDRAIAYGIPGETIDSNDVMEIYEKVGRAIDRARKGEGPSIIECKTYRIFGHEEGDLQTYKIKSDIEAWGKKDPIEIFKKWLIEEGALTEVEVSRINQEIKTEVEEAVKFAKESPYPAPEETLEDVYV
jgi:TPP-dependent pyruvate/acetoin dehydrogenase alpha subunit